VVSTNCGFENLSQRKASIIWYILHNIVVIICHFLYNWYLLNIHIFILCHVVLNPNYQRDGGDRPFSDVILCVWNFIITNIPSNSTTRYSRLIMYFPFNYFKTDMVWYRHEEDLDMHLWTWGRFRYGIKIRKIWTWYGHHKDVCTWYRHEDDLVMIQTRGRFGHGTDERKF
jgi:hypothetical protein